MPRIIVDCTHTFQTGAGTGIQRVVRHFADELLALARPGSLDVVPVRLAGAAAIPLPVEGGRVAFPRARASREKDVLDHRLHEARLLGQHVNRVLRSRALARWIAAGPNEDGLARRLAPRRAAEAGAIAFAPSDIFLSLDSSWVYDIRSALEAAGRAGAKRAILLHDVLPLSHPQWFTAGTREYFRGWLDAILPRLEGVIGNSATTCAALRARVDAGDLRARTVPPCAAIHLGAEIEPAGGGAVRPALQAMFAAGSPPAFLTVGTLEPRKNVDYAIDLFDELAALGLDFQWHLVGSAGWLADKTVKRIRGHAQHGHRLHWWTDLGDAELAHCYRHAAALVAVSRAEGFGLPLVEARLQGLPVFASDIPVFREVLGREARYLPLDSPRVAAAALEDFLAGACPWPKAQASAIARPWRESAGELLEALLALQG